MMIIGLPCRFKQCLWAFSMLTVKGCSETRHFRHLCSHVFGSPSFPKYINNEGHLLFQGVPNLMKISEKERKVQKNFLDNTIWIGCSKPSLLQRECLSSAVTLSTNNPKISHITKKDIFQLYFPYNDEKIW